MKKYDFQKLRLKALFLLFLMLFQIISPTISWALTSGPSQPDFSAYEEPNSTDMVNLITGDFTYNIPLLQVPSPEGGFSMPLSYHAGIQLEEESTWVGLGWSLNAGAISRNVVQYPDDYVAQPLTTTVGGYSGDGFVNNFIFYQKYYDSKKGNGGTVGYGNVFTIGWGSMKNETTVLGISNQGFDVMGFASGVTEIAALYASTGASAAPQGSAYALSILDKGFIATQSSINENRASNSGSSNFSSADFDIDKDKPRLFWPTKYSYSLNVDKTEKMFGSLYLNKIDDNGGLIGNRCLLPFAYNNNPQNLYASNYAQFVPKIFTSTYLAVSDMHMASKPGSYADWVSPTSIAYDNYSVMGAGISGEIQPFRLDVGSLSYPNLGSSENAKMNLINFLDYKVNFKYSNENSNSYTNSLGDNSDNVEHPKYGFGISFDDFTEDKIGENYLDCSNNRDSYSSYLYEKFPQDESWVNWYTTDKTVSSEFAADYISNQRKEANRLGLKNNHLASGKFVKWYSNLEIINGVAKADGFMDALSTEERTGRPVDGIGGFMITKEDGLTYHYSIPVYNKYIINYAHSADGINSTITNNNSYAYNWLLTGITGPDFLDRVAHEGVIDEDDYGYWVKFDYGLFASNFNWRNPYFGVNYSPNSSNETSFSIGTKETYYLNKISTRTHTALFVKSLKSDGKGDFSREQSYPLISSALRLDDIILLSNKDYQTLITPLNEGGQGVESDFNSGEGNTNSTSFNNVLDNYDLNSPATQAFLNLTQIRKIHFNYSYDLCRKTYNSYDFDANGNPPIYSSNLGGFRPASEINKTKGKLTLKSFDVYGKNNFKITPPFIFDYGNINNFNENPNYDPYKWDGWGMYSSRGTSSISSHKPQNEGAQWSLKSIMTPMGAQINVKYDRDTYSSINGYFVNLKVPANVNALDNKIVITDPTIKNDFVVGDVLKVVSNITNYKYGVNLNDPNYYTNHWYSTGKQTKTINLTVTAVNSGILTVSPNILEQIQVTSASLIKPNSPAYGNQYSSVVYDVSTQSRFVYGGDLRVKEIAIKGEDGQALRTRYVYTNDGNVNSSTSSGCVSFEPEFSRNQDLKEYDYFDHPITPVLYSKVTVYSNISSSDDNSFLNKKEYRFATPDASNLSYYEVPIDNRHLRTIQESKYIAREKKKAYYLYASKMNHLIFRDYTSKIGSLISVKNWNNKNQLLNEVNFKYTDNSSADIPNKQGIYGESTVLSDETVYNSGLGRARLNGRNFRLNRTSKIKYPYILKEVENTYNGQTIVSKNEDFDFITGQPTTTKTTYPDGSIYTTKVVPAYYQYPGMGSKVDEIANKNMLSQNTAVYNYVSFNNESDKLISASVNLWNNSWDYREYNTSTNVYNYASYTDVWRKHQSFVWKSPVNAAGVIPYFSDFDWNSSTHSGWDKVSEVTYYDHFSRPIEVKDINGNFSASKMGHNENYIIASSPTSNYESFFHTSFEDKNNVVETGTPVYYFGGEVMLNNGIVVPSNSPYKAHTGDYLVKIPKSSTSLTFGPYYSVKGGLQTGKTYRASVWVHKQSSTATALVAHLNSGTIDSYNSMTITSSKAISVGDWKLLTVNVVVPSNYSPTGGSNNDLRVYVYTGTGGTANDAYVDDMRLQPVNSPVTGYVYDEPTGLLKAVLDNENFATLFTYDGAGRLIKTEKETAKGVKKVSETTYHYGGQ